MPRRSILSAIERTSLLTLPESQDDLIRYYTFNESDLSLIRQHRSEANRLGFAVQLCLLRYPGCYALSSDMVVAEPVINGWPGRSRQRPPHGRNMANATRQGASTFRNCAPILDFRPLANPTSIF